MTRSTFCFFLIVIVSQCQSQDIGYPEHVEDVLVLPSNNNSVISKPGLCGKNEYYYPGDVDNDYVCDCRPGYIFNTDDEACYAAFEKGPCKKYEILVLDKDGFTAVCKYDHCTRSGKVNMKNNCVKLGAACDHDTRRVFGVNESTLVVECLGVSRIYGGFERKPPPTTTTQKPKVHFASRISLDDVNEETPKIEVIVKITCLPGCKRHIYGKCPNSEIKDDNKTA